LPVSDAAVLSKYADCVLYVVKSDTTTVAQIRNGLGLLERVNAPIMGIVLTQFDVRKAEKYGDDGYGTSYEPYASSLRRPDLRGGPGHDRPALSFSARHRRRCADARRRLALAQAAVADGITYSVMTPHIDPGRYQNTRSTIEKAFKDFRLALRKARVALHIGMAAEVRLSPTSSRC